MGLTFFGPPCILIPIRSFTVLCRMLRQLRQLRRSAQTDTFQLPGGYSLVLTRLDFGNSAGRSSGLLVPPITVGAEI